MTTNFSWSRDRSRHRREGENAGKQSEQKIACIKDASPSVHKRRLATESGTWYAELGLCSALIPAEIKPGERYEEPAPCQKRARASSANWTIGADTGCQAERLVAWSDRSPAWPFG